MNKPIALATAAILVALTSACASFSVTDDAIERNTAQSLGLAKGTFTITDRSNDGVKASYLVRTDNRKQFSCYVTGGISVTGRAASDAICSELGKGGMSGKPATDGACNALLKAAGKC